MKKRQITWILLGLYIVSILVVQGHTTRATTIEQETTLISGIDPVREINSVGDVIWAFSRTQIPNILPTYISLDADRLENGNTLITFTNMSLPDPQLQDSNLVIPGVIVEVSPLGEIVWSLNHSLNFPHDADRLLNGNTLVVNTQGNNIIEVNPQGDIVWQYDTEAHSRPNDIDVLSNGNILISLKRQNSLLEINKQGEKIWWIDGTGIWEKQHNPDVLPNGNIILCESRKGRILEIDRDGNILWEYVGLMHPRDADRLSSENTLITEANRIIEINSKDEVIWQYENWTPTWMGEIFYDADRLSSTIETVTIRITTTIPEFGIQFGSIIPVATLIALIILNSRRSLHEETRYS